MLLLIDNYDSFTYNLVQYFCELGADVRVMRNDQMELDEIISLRPRFLVISPGPGNPTESGISLQALQHFDGQIPILGVCLGHQCLGQLYGGNVVRSQSPMHGKTSLIYHASQGIFAGIPTPFDVTRYHSLIIQPPLPEALTITATTAEGEIMAIQHQVNPTFGVQFHPESILTQHGKTILQNFLNFA